MTDLAVSTLSRDEARQLTDEVKQDADRLWRKLVELYEGGAHLSLGYPSWGAYFKTEFGGSQSRAYQILDAGRVAQALDSTMVERPTLNERQARELAPLLDDPAQMQDAWEEASANGEPTALKVREAVQSRTLTFPPMSDEQLERQQRDTLIQVLDQAVYALEGPPSNAAAEAARLLAAGDPGPFTPSRFDRVSSYAATFAQALREAGVDG